VNNRRNDKKIAQKFSKHVQEIERNITFAPGEMAEWSIAAVLKTVEGNTSGGSNPSLSAQNSECPARGIFYFRDEPNLFE
jgi:hypothetical protein